MVTVAAFSSILQRSEYANKKLRCLKTPAFGQISLGAVQRGWSGELCWRASLPLRASSNDTANFSIALLAA